MGLPLTGPYSLPRECKPPTSSATVVARAASSALIFDQPAFCSNAYEIPRLRIPPNAPPTKPSLNPTASCAVPPARAPIIAPVVVSLDSVLVCRFCILKLLKKGVSIIHSHYFRMCLFYKQHLLLIAN